jgi:ubiquinol oxidase
MVGYFEDQAVISYTQYLERIERGDIPNIAAPQIAIDYYGLESNAKLDDVVKAVRLDEQGHADVNHKMADELK